VYLKSLIILRTGVLYSIIICFLISISCFYSSLLISLKEKRTQKDSSLIYFLNLFGLYWILFAISNVFGWLNIGDGYRSLAFILNLLLFLQPLPLFYYFSKSKLLTSFFALVGFSFYMFTLGSAQTITSISYWGIQSGVAETPRLIYIFGLMLPLSLLAFASIIYKCKVSRNDFFPESIALIFIIMETVTLFIGTITWQFLLFRMLYLSIGFIAYFHLTAEEATVKFAGRISPWIEKQMERVRAYRMPFFAKLIMLFLLLSVLPLAAAGALMFLTFKEIIDLYIYKPLLWNLKTSKEEFLVALENVQVQAFLLILIVIILVLIVSIKASRAIAHSLKRISDPNKKVEEGDYDCKLEGQSNDEIGDLANYFNRMAAEIKRSREIMENWNKELEHTVEERTKNLQTLYSLSKAMGSTLDLDALLNKSIKHIPKIKGANYLSVFIKDEKGIYSAKVTINDKDKISFKSGEGSFGKAVSEEQLIKIVDSNKLSQTELETLKPLKIKTIVLVPLERKGEKIGLIAIGSQDEYTPSDMELNLLSTIADQMAIGIENANVYEKEKEAVKKLLELGEMKTELISMVSHELRTPLTSIRGFLKHFIGGNTGPVNEQQMKFLKIMSKEGDRLLELIDSLLEFSRVERGVFEIKKAKVNIDSLVKGIVDAFKPQIDGKNITLSLDLTVGKKTFNGDEVKIGQVIRNLISNAIKFVKDDPKIDISTKVNKKNNLEITVKDNGMGIDNENLEKIFDKFCHL